MAECKLFHICNCKTAVCRVREPDETCYYYRYFKNFYLTNEKDYIENNVKLLQNNTINFQTFYNNLKTKECNYVI